MLKRILIKIWTCLEKMSEQRAKNLMAKGGWWV